MSVKVGAPRTALSMLSRTYNLSGGPRLESKIQQLGVSSSFKILHDRIVTPGDASSSSRACRTQILALSALRFVSRLTGPPRRSPRARCVQAWVERTHVTKLARLMLPLPSR